MEQTTGTVADDRDQPCSTMLYRRRITGKASGRIQHGALSSIESIPFWDTSALAVDALSWSCYSSSTPRPEGVPNSDQLLSKSFPPQKSELAAES